MLLAFSQQLKYYLLPILEQSKLEGVSVERWRSPADRYSGAAPTVQRVLRGTQPDPLIQKSHPQRSEVLTQHINSEVHAYLWNHIPKYSCIRNQNNDQ